MEKPEGSTAQLPARSCLVTREEVVNLFSDDLSSRQKEIDQAALVATKTRAVLTSEAAHFKCLKSALRLYQSSKHRGVRRQALPRSALEMSGSRASSVMQG